MGALEHKESTTIRVTIVKAEISIILLPFPPVFEKSLKTMPVAAAKRKNPTQKKFHFGKGFISALASKHSRMEKKKRQSQY